MNEVFTYPPIEPNSFDLIVVGTGLPESLIAASASAVGKTVLHLDPNPFYGAHFASLSLNEITSFLYSHSTPITTPFSDFIDNLDFVTLHLTTRSLYSGIEVSSYAPRFLQEISRKFSIDLAGPRVLFCADQCIDLVLKSGTSQYLEFKSIDASYVCDKNGRLLSVPDSRATIFKDKSLSLTEKTQLMRFFKLVQQHLDPDEGGEGAKISEEDLESPFVEFLKKMRLPPKIKSIILYAISMANYDQEDVEACKDIVKTREGVDRLALYHSSVGRFPNALGALIYPIYGHGELSQAFCRRAAVKGCLYVLRMPVIALLADKDGKQYKGVRLASGQVILSQDLVLDPSIIVSSPLSSSIIDHLSKCLEDLRLRKALGKVARGICITRRSLFPDVKNCLVVYPPKTLSPEQVTSVRVLQVGGDLAVCPSGMWILYYSTLCEDADQGKKMLHAAMNVSLADFTSGKPGTGTTGEDDNADDIQTMLLWRVLYVQDIISTGQFGSISSTPTADGYLNYNDILDSTLKLFQKMYPQEEFFPETSSENPEDDSEFGPES